MTNPELHTKKRLVSLDVFRGVTIMAMIIVNSPGSWSYMYAPLQHASWHGLTPTDLVFPFFLFIVGFSISYSLSKYTNKQPEFSIYKKISWRSLKIFVVGILLWLLFEPDLANIRWPGVLQRIAICFFITAILYINLNIKHLIIITLVLLVSYSLVLLYVPVPIDEIILNALNEGEIPRAHGFAEVEIYKNTSESIKPNLEPGTNISAFIDRYILPGPLYEKSWDPEGLLSTIPAIATTLLGAILGSQFRIHQIKTKVDRMKFLITSGILLLISGMIISLIIPLNKNLWTPSFVLVTGGLAVLVFTLCYFIYDIRNYRPKLKIGQALGANAITAYVLSFVLLYVFYNDLIWGVSLNEEFMKATKDIGFNPKLSSFIYSLIYAFIIFIPLNILYKKKIYIKL
ncbi:heparan-alpha-glucosaminide N-acetyltransferase domain-containing protein [Mangrovivirga sp. M17]|uniref:Heparan-alpha-glucosaminide N-acetyltransferase domain-containing protein n=1 Tax=Mangrovivirga halotolerans TaxID=2993936 RepID=A0ABT3RN36_9BACT|nr:heparan-alpha-glucosaminide N-acetyltransferase domain-containing protein [Mangrovivirga halotolerans]MCX2743222.1 heparan-alpha-glucosaminide N-acetyltransferase domain-containing protein [Mangrovivirga halotolerans]